MEELREGVSDSDRERQRTDEARGTGTEEWERWEDKWRESETRVRG